MTPYAISRDSPWSHRAWQEALDIDVPLLSDWNGDAVHAFGIATELNGLRDVAGRTAFLADTEGVVRGAWRYDAGEVPDVDELVRAARAL